MMSDDWLNYHHLLYFWTVAHEGSVTRASEKLHLSQPTISGQLRKLEESLGEKLYTRVGRDLVLTDVGKTVYRYADEIFSIGRELVDTVKGRPTGSGVRLVVGLPQVLPKLIAFRLLEPVLQLEEKVQIVCREGSMHDLLTQLAAHELDVVFADSPASSLVSVRAFNHSLGECGIGLFGVPALCDRFGGDLPESLNGAPFILPAEGTLIRRSIDQWIDGGRFYPDVVGEMDDTALMKVFAEASVGFVPAPLAIAAEIEAQFGLRLLMEVPGAIERFYAITVQRRLQHPAVLAISQAAKNALFK
ncbi:MAG: LysR family transcriptional regulator [Planctomycetaceae bacterium]